MAKKGQKQKKYSAEFKIRVIMDMRENHLGYCETARKYCIGTTADIGKNRIKLWERIYLEEGEAGFHIERRGRTTKMSNPKKGRPRKQPLEATVEEDLIAENQRLREQVEWLQMENDYLKKLDALVLRDEQLYGKKRKP